MKTEGFKTEKQLRELGVDIDLFHKELNELGFNQVHGHPYSGNLLALNDNINVGLAQKDVNHFVMRGNICKQKSNTELDINIVNNTSFEIVTPEILINHIKNLLKIFR